MARSKAKLFARLVIYFPGLEFEKRPVYAKDPLPAGRNGSPYS